MTLSTQLRIILLLVGTAIFLAIYWLGKRKSVAQGDSAAMLGTDMPRFNDNTTAFEPADELDEDELDTPAYMRRHGLREARQDYEPRIADANDYLDADEVRDAPPHFVDIKVHNADALPDKRAQEFAVAAARISADEEIYAEPIYADPLCAAPAAAVIDETAFEVHSEPVMSMDQEVVHAVMAVPAVEAAEMEPVAGNSPAIPVMAESVADAYKTPSPVTPASTLAAAAPTLSQVVSSPPATQRAAVPAASSTKPAVSTPNRKIIALRLPMPQRVPGAQLATLFEQERLQHGKFNIFHRLQDAGTVFSVASMVEPGSFNPERMATQDFPGVTLFMMLPGPLDGLVAYDQMLSCAQRLAHATGGELHDERGSKLTTHNRERLRDEVLDFQHLLGGVTASH
jgi:cell division protein ZipA